MHAVLAISRNRHLVLVIMAKKKKPPHNKITFTRPEEQTFSFDLDAGLFIAALWRTVEQEVKQLALDMSEDKMCIPKSTVIKAAKQLGLDEWIKKIPKYVETDEPE